MLLASCSSCQSKREEPAAAVRVDLDQVPEGKLVIKDLAYIPLETTGEVLLGRISKLLYRDGKFYVLDQKSGGVFVFDEKGKHLTSILKKGEGPGEYIELMDMDVDKAGNVYVFDNARRNILCYRQADAGDCEVIPVGEHCMEIGCLDERRFLLRNVFGPDGLKAKLAVWDQNGEKLDVLVGSEAGEADEMKVLQVASHAVCRSADKLYYNERFTPHIYAVDLQGKMHAAYTLASGRYASHDLLKGMEGNPPQFLQDMRHIKDIVCIYENARYLICQPYASPLSPWLLIPKSDPSAARLVNFFQEPRLRGMSMIEGVADGRFFSYLPDPAALSEEAKQDPALQGLSEDANPVVVMFDVE